eukprot:2341469-Prymnesium_polylepis.1
MSADEPLDKSLRSQSASVWIGSAKKYALIWRGYLRMRNRHVVTCRTLLPPHSSAVQGQRRRARGKPEALPMRLAWITASEAEQLDKLRLEVYVGFWEIIAPADSTPTPVPASAPVPASQAPVPAPVPASKEQSPSPHPDQELFDEFDMWRQN